LVRAVLGWSRTELAQRIGLTQSAIHKLEQGETEPAAQNCDRTRRNMASAKLNSLTGGKFIRKRFE
jgi:ribosome-binding protein aMBF1 (putative translation factor)